MPLLDLKPTLVMGASGSVGAHVLAELLDRGRPVRASARRPEPGRFPAGLDVRAADLTDPRSFDAAFDGVGQVFLYAYHETLLGRPAIGFEIWAADHAGDLGVER